MTDHLGSTEGLADASGAIASSTSYDSFGNATSNIQTSYRYTGREYDSDTGLYYYRNRWYDPEVGLFISKDPIGFAGGDVNLYRYVWNNPQNFVDPYGDVPFLALLLRLFSAGAYVMMNPSYVNAPAPCKPVIRASDEVSVGGILGAAAGMAGGPILGKVAGAVLRGAAGAISKGLSAAGRAIQKASKSVKRSKGAAAKGSPKPGSLSNKATRRWYHRQLDSIPSRIDSSLPLREQALQAFKLRNEIKLKARELMADRATAASLPKPQTLQKVVKKAYR